MPKIDFSASAKRHFQDAQLLEDNQRLANAGQLYGFCAECGIKALLISLGYPTDTEGSPVEKPSNGEPYIRVHINQLAAIKNEIDIYARGRNGAKYLALIPNADSFSDWSVHHRYYDEQKIPSSLSAWRQAAIEVSQMMQEAKIDGVLQ
jgi:hypothetical protein